ncbi:MbtH protein [Kitasatospora sp. SolWspMP-SS2h]|uniref:MbtH family protein n=1 Tax=Kitasatospora sp. SolWspMP-SS2h TaxID=1305729 RepID=UPI000DB96D44|nr:MbtH family protein [Kitasatospora sp. SolWspMP-SS2h]RAJ40387.1 MbtH protein [Kitasatospora sp. SolWspMP-SS2h]
MSDSTPEYLVVVNHENQHSIWEAALPVPAGWTPEGFTGPKEDCLARIEEVWTDLRPRGPRTHA